MNTKAINEFSNDQRQFKTVTAMVENGGRPFTITAMAKVIGRDKLTVRNNVHALAKAGFVRRLKKTIQQEGRGRPEQVWAFNRHAGKKVRVSVEPLSV